MFVPFFSSATSQNLHRRKGGGKGASGSSKSSSSSKSSKSSSSSSKSKTKTITTSSRSGSTTFRSSTYSNSRAVTPAAIPAGQLFAGRLSGGGTRSQIFGTRTYGSGYPGVPGRGTAGRGFPFIFWPIAWPLAALAAGRYLNDDDEYGTPTNTSRPGGQLTTATFTSLVNTTTPYTPSFNSTFRIFSDNATVVSLFDDLFTNCSSLIRSANSSTPYAGTPVPEQVVQYYRASSIALSLEGYDNTATYSSSDNATDTPLPTDIDLALLNCLNQTIGLAAPLIDAASPHFAPNFGFSFVGLLLILWTLVL
ncbi:hypothetical protein GALMADRAFT_76106 [Galerina marginata CBS 339.88]|uniref:Uncharacterized protein n=1 Tax=Galerina marginata (strain CBS 339.88) TaxID=685588 RepID=A0A067SHN3_GALM3|nr:hypothetical protein GALMADRAFT_76106 [Galerina marginata CBS 339.88]